MKEFGVRRYGDLLYRHCLADTAEAAADWFAHSQEMLAGKDFQALVLDLALPPSEAAGSAINPQTVLVRHGPLSDAGRKVTDLKRTSPLR